MTSCVASKFKWETKKLNSKIIIEEQDSVLFLDGISKDKSYGYTSKNPIKLGVKDQSLALTYPLKYFNSILGPNGEQISSQRIKSCCPFKSVNSKEYPYQNLAVLEVYKVNVSGSPLPIYLYINFFDEGKVLAPRGFSLKKTK
jgi:hypothetical protein